MKICILGTAGSSMHLAPFGDASFNIWGCSPGTYPYLPRVNAFFELHRWEPGVVGKPATQKPWFTPEYVAWMAGLPPSVPVWMHDHVAAIPSSRRLPVEDLCSKYGTYFFTSSIAWMLACAIEDILEARAKFEAESGRPVDWSIVPDRDVIALFGVDMAANEEYGYQRAGCQHFLLLAADLGIQIVVPPESDLLRPMPLYGIDESSHWAIKLLARKNELTARLNGITAQLSQLQGEQHYIRGALDDLDYCTKTWGAQHEGMGTAAEIMAQSPRLREAVLAGVPPPAPTGAGQAAPVDNIYV